MNLTYTRSVLRRLLMNIQDGYTLDELKEDIEFEMQKIENIKVSRVELRVINFLAEIFKHKHKFTNTHFNRYGIPTRRECKCGYSEEQRHPPEHFGDDYVWYPESQKDL